MNSENFTPNIPQAFWNQYPFFQGAFFPLDQLDDPRFSAWLEKVQARGKTPTLVVFGDEYPNNRAQIESFREQCPQAHLVWDLQEKPRRGFSEAEFFLIKENCPQEWAHLHLITQGTKAVGVLEGAEFEGAFTLHAPRLQHAHGCLNRIHCNKSCTFYLPNLEKFHSRALSGCSFNGPCKISAPKLNMGANMKQSFLCSAFYNCVSLHIPLARIPRSVDPPGLFSMAFHGRVDIENDQPEVIDFITSKGNFGPNAQVFSRLGKAKIPDANIWKEGGCVIQ